MYKDGIKSFTIGPLGLLALTLAMFFDVLFLPGDAVLSGVSSDLATQFVHWRGFGFGEIARGNLPLWNPHIYCGAPFLAGFQSALLYPLNVLYLVLPLAKAINWGIALHAFLGGLFFYLWALKRGLHPLACFLAGAEFIFCAPFFLHIYAGHLPNLCTMIWAPLLFLAIDGHAREARRRMVSPGDACRGDADPRRPHPVCLLHGDRGRDLPDRKAPGGR